MNVNLITVNITDEEWKRLLNMDIAPCPYCHDYKFAINGGLWCYGERVREDGDWEDTISFGCNQCESSGPQALNRGDAVLGWNIVVGYIKHPEDVE